MSFYGITCHACNSHLINAGYAQDILYVILNWYCDLMYKSAGFFCGMWYMQQDLKMEDNSCEGQYYFKTHESTPGGCIKQD